MNNFYSCRVSIICPVYNTELYLSDTIRSVLSQTYPHWELLLVIDAKSTDQSQRIATEWTRKDSRILVLESEFNLGVASNRNHGIRKAKGDFIAFLDSDDQWLPQKLDKQIQFMDAHSIEFSYHSYQQINENGQPLPLVRKAPTQVTYHDLLKTNSIGCLSVMIRTSLLKRHPFQSNVPHEDYLLWLEILKEISLAHGFHDVLALYRVLPNSRSGNKKNAALNRWTIYRKILHMSLLKSIYYFSHYTLNALLQRVKARRITPAYRPE
jgi:teichuronic acid biosynthesis glycosyltransferase TuaG